ncbi:MAG: hypothetical protein CL940_10250 [Deltaproteobacteria bacterium]|nr:hypothetical protein [Deltaproteobacteria bacterium]
MSQASSGRQNTRIDLGVEVNLESEHNFYTGFTENISTGGLFIATRDMLPIGTRIHMTFTLGGGSEISANVEVRWHRLEQAGSDGLSPGIGVRFLDLTPEQQSAVNEFIAQRETLFYLED